MATTSFPVSFDHLQQILNRLGYGLVKHGQSNDTRVIIWEKDQSIAPEFPHNGPNQITTLLPDFDCIGFEEEQVYERDYVLDLLNSVMDGDFDKDGQTIQALLLDYRSRLEH